MKKAFFIFYVQDQNLSTEFYKKVFDQEPVLFVPGMTEFKLCKNTSLGLMPSTGIKQLLGDPLPDPSEGHGIPRAELYLHVDNPQIFHNKALENGAKELSPLTNRDWGDRAAYSLDPDGHVLGFAESLKYD